MRTTNDEFRTKVASADLSCDDVTLASAFDQKT